ncbi:MAG: heavy-metal-associated domain-containing protein [Cytophagaceae bacterium]|nr:heavy-metal-associated domain-containing protein [Cytophagaceae bacterium]
MKKTFIFLLVFYLLHQFSQAQFKSASLGVDGLTCSMCTNSVEKLIRQLDFVKATKMDLNSTVVEIIFKEGKKVNINSLAGKVYDAGFSVRFLKAVFNFDTISISDYSSFTFEDEQYDFIKSGNKKLSGETVIIFLTKINFPSGIL